MRKAKKCGLIPFNFPRKDANGNSIVKVGFVRAEDISAIEPGGSDGLSHLHLVSGAELITTYSVRDIEQNLTN